MPSISSPRRFVKLVRRLRPSRTEVEHYARMIAAHEQQPDSAWSSCVAEVEIQLWAARSLLGGQEAQVGGMDSVGAA